MSRIQFYTSKKDDRHYADDILICIFLIKGFEF